MSELKKIALIVNASNFEFQNYTVKSIHRKLKELGNYALYVFTSYIQYEPSGAYRQEIAPIYTLLDKYDFDGCIFDGNIADENKYIVDILQKINIPCISLNRKISDYPSVTADNYPAVCMLLEHLITVHNCTKINMVLHSFDGDFSGEVIRAYRDVLEKYNIPFNPDRLIKEGAVSLSNGQGLFDVAKKRNLLDADAFFCMHDVFAIGLCLALEKNGYKVPDNYIICSLSHSSNSTVFRPAISGVDRMLEVSSEQACTLLHDMLNGKTIPSDNHFPILPHYCASCGCKEDVNAKQKYCDIVISKIETGNQISNMMQYNAALEEVSSLDEFGEKMSNLFNGLHFNGFLCCFNKKDIPYILGETDEYKFTPDAPYDSDIIVISGASTDIGEIRNYSMQLNELLPVTPKKDDIFIFLPIQRNKYVYGYAVSINDYTPIEQNNYRICHDSIANSAENLRKKMILKKTIDELDTLHMQDALTNLYNRFALKRFQEKYTSRKQYTVVMIDMDGLKTINDNYGHLSGNHAICIVADVLKNNLSPDDLIMRYGGDEFVVCSYNIDTDYWEQQKDSINQKLTDYTIKEQLPYKLGASLGYAICEDSSLHSFDEYCEIADKYMYENKRSRKAQRK